MLLSSSQITDDNRALKLLWVKWLVAGLISSQDEKLMTSNYRNLTLSVIPIALTDEKSRYKLTGLGMSSNTVVQPSRESFK